MNHDHADALALFARTFGGRPDAVEARMVGCGRYGFAMLARDVPDGDATAVRLSFRARVDTPDAARAAMVELVREARASENVRQ
jgi:putative heme iron utilization protein